VTLPAWYDVTTHLVVGYMAGAVVYSIMANGGEDRPMSPRWAFSMFLISPVSLPLFVGGMLFALAVVSAFDLVKWWTAPVVEFYRVNYPRKPNAIKANESKKKKPTWDELDVLWQEVSVQLEKLGVPEPPKPKNPPISDRPIPNRCLCSNQVVCEHHRNSSLTNAGVCTGKSDCPCHRCYFEDSALKRAARNSLSECTCKGDRKCHWHSGSFFRGTVGQ
jgi:hypothetical protein